MPLDYDPPAAPPLTDADLAAMYFDWLATHADTSTEEVLR